MYIMEQSIGVLTYYVQEAGYGLSVASFATEWERNVAHRNASHNEIQRQALQKEMCLGTEFLHW